MNPTKFFRKEPLFNIQEFSVPLKVGSESAILRSSKQADIQETFNLLTSAVQHGDGFAVDEFPNVELFQSRFLNGRQLIILEDRNNIIGVAVIGAAILCRSTNSPCSILYLYVKPKYRKRGYGSAMLKYLEGYLRQQQYSSMITDVFMTKDIPHEFLKNHEFIPTGVIPMSGYIKGMGYTDCMLYHKCF